MTPCMIMTLEPEETASSIIFSDTPTSFSIESPPAEDLQEVDGYLEASEWETAREVLELLDEMFPGAPEVQARWARLHAATGGDTTTEMAERLLVEDQPHEAVSAEADPVEHEAERSDEFELDDDLLQFLDDLPGLLDDEPLPECLPGEEEDNEQLDFETHYNRALVYRDMELLGKVVREIEKALRAEPPQTDEAASYFQCYYLLGQACSQNGNRARAIESFLQGLEIGGLGDDEYQAMRYDLGLAYDADGQSAKALEVFMEILTTDINYRDVRDRIKRLQSMK